MIPYDLVFPELREGPDRVVDTQINIRAFLKLHEVTVSETAHIAAQTSRTAYGYVRGKANFGMFKGRNLVCRVFDDLSFQMMLEVNLEQEA